MLRKRFRYGGQDLDVEEKYELKNLFTLFI